ncbi:MAG: hypothetical protein AAF441_10075 [Pseudomonadota bacterium]
MFRVLFLSTLVGLSAPAAPALGQEAKYYSDAEVEKMLDGMRRWERSFAAMAAKREGHYQAPGSLEYIGHWLETMRTNLDKIGKRKKVSRKVVEKYFRSLHADTVKFIEYEQLARPLWEMHRNPLYTAKDCGICRKFLIEGKDVWAYYAEIAATSRPEPIRFEEVELRISLNRPRTGVDYWADRMPELGINLSNMGEDDAEGINLNAGFSARINKGVVSQDFDCINSAVTGSAQCIMPQLEAGATHSLRVQFDLKRRALSLTGANSYRTIVSLDLKAKSSSPEAAAEEKVTFAVRACRRAYTARLRKIKRRELVDLQRRIDAALASAAGLPGKIMRPLPGRSASESGLTRTVREIASGGGRDAFLSRQSVSGSRLLRVRRGAADIVEDLMGETRNGRVCANPVGHIARFRQGIAAVVDRARAVARLAERARSEAAHNTFRFRSALHEVGPESVKNGGDVVAAAGKKGGRVVANQVVNRAIEALNLAESKLVEPVAKRAGPVALAAGAVEILLSIADLVDLRDIRDDELQEALAWLEHSAYLAALDGRYQGLVQAAEQFLTAFDRAYAEACTCVEPFEG